MKMIKPMVLAVVALLSMGAVCAEAREMALAEKGQAKCVIVAPAGWTNEAVMPEGLPRQAVGLLKGAIGVRARHSTLCDGPRAATEEDSS